MKMQKMGFILILFLVIMPLRAQEQGSGIVREFGWDGRESNFNPYSCFDSVCERTTALLYPTLFAIDAQNGAIVPATSENFGLITSAFNPSETVQTLTLRDDLRWHDGKTIDAYDIFYSVLADAAYFDLFTQDIQALRVIDAQTIEIKFYSADCSIPSRINLPIVPAHIYEPNFKTLVDEFDFSGDITERLTAFLRNVYPFSRFSVLDSKGLNTSSNRFIFEETRPNLDLRLVTPDKQTAYVSVYPNSQSPQNTAVQMFLDGQTNILVNPPLNRRVDIVQDEQLRVDEYPSRWQAVMILNTANPRNPLSAFDKNGDLREQGQHPFFSDLRVRQAVQYAIDVQELIDVALLGHGTPQASFQVPSSWAFNPELQPISQNVAEARRLLDEAGWRDVGNDGVLNCVDCLYATEGTPFTMTLQYGNSDENTFDVTANLIAEQLRAVGIQVQVNFNPDPSQNMDAFLTIIDGLNEPDPSRLLSRLADNAILGSGNIGSFYDEEVENLIQSALAVTSCSIDERASLYRELDVLLQQKQPYIWLYTVNDFVVSRGIRGIAPTAFDPLWNITEWSVQS